MLRNTIARVLAVHLCFHTIWVLVYCVSLLGVFILIPLVGLYNAFVLGFLGKSVLASATQAALLGFAVFGVTGLFSGFVISGLRLKSVWTFTFLSLVVTIFSLVSATWMRYNFIGVSGLGAILPLPAGSGSEDAEKLRWALKGESLQELPPHLPGKGVVISLTELQPSLSLLPKDFLLAGGPYVYCNLPSHVWGGLKKDAPRKYALLWATQPDPTGKRLVFSVDLRTDIFDDELVSEETFSQMLTALESAVRKQTGDVAFTLPK